ncbi:MAG: RluA family pseudouridine synthase [Myxococcota bacterium]
MKNIIKVKDRFHGKRIEKILKANFPNISNREWKISLNKQNITLADNTPVKWGDRYAAGTEIKIIKLPPSKNNWLPLENKINKIKIITENEFWLALDKPSGIHSLPLASTDNKNVASHLRHLRPEIVEKADPPSEGGIVNRLDYWTSGLLVAAKSPRIYIKLRGCLSNHRLEKEYIALVKGKAPQRQWLHGKVAGTGKDRTVFTPGEEGKGRRAISLLETLDYNRGISLVKLTTRFGCRHQIRVQLQSLDLPIMGDVKYGAEPLAFPGFFLWARKITIPVNPEQKRSKKTTLTSVHLPANRIDLLKSTGFEPHFPQLKSFS